MNVTTFIRDHFKHFNAAVVTDAAQAYVEHLQAGGKMFLAMGGAMSTAEIGRSLAEMIRQDKIHAICCTGANLEEDLFNLVAHDRYKRIPSYRELSPQDEMALRSERLCRVTDTCIPENHAIEVVEEILLAQWTRAEVSGERYFPHEFLYRVLQEHQLDDRFEADPRHSWLVAAAEKELPLFVPGWEDSTLGNAFASAIIRGEIQSPQTVKTGIEYMLSLIRWYSRVAPDAGVGFFQIGGGIAGDFPICVVPLLRLDIESPEFPCWGYFCQISDSTTSYGSYSGAVPDEKISWNKLDLDTPRFMIESDATIVAPLIFAYVLGW